MTASAAWMQKYRKEYYRKNRDKYLEAAKRHIEKKKAANPRHFSEQHLRRTYDMSIEEYDAQVEAQGGVCAICGRAPNGRFKRLVVDHNHTTNKRRGLLCNACNRGIGYLGEDITRLQAAAIYLKRYTDTEPL